MGRPPAFEHATAPPTAVAWIVTDKAQTTRPEHRSSEPWLPSHLRSAKWLSEIVSIFLVGVGRDWAKAGRRFGRPQVRGWCWSLTADIYSYILGLARSGHSTSRRAIIGGPPWRIDTRAPLGGDRRYLHPHRRTGGQRPPS